jgi:hypothetical protein
VSPAGVNLAPMPASRKRISVLLRTRAEVTDWTCSELRSALRTNASCDWIGSTARGELWGGVKLTQK